MSSRNLRLNPSDRKIASELHHSLILIKNNLHNEDFLTLKSRAIKDLEKKGFKVEYLELAKKKDLEIVSDFKSREKLIILIAAFLNNVRLIDNVLITP